MDLETTLRACLSGDKAVRDAAEAAIAQLQKQRQSPLQLFQVMQASQHEEVSQCTLRIASFDSCCDSTAKTLVKGVIICHSTRDQLAAALSLSRCAG